MLERLKYIVAAEGLECSEKVYAKVLELSKGDMRKAVTTLQSVFTLYGRQAKTLGVTVEAVVDVTGTMEPGTMAALWEAIEGGDYETLSMCLEDIQLEGYGAPTIMDQLLDTVVAHPTLTDTQKGKMGLCLGRVDKKLMDGANDSIQILDICCECMRIATNM